MFRNHSISVSALSVLILGLATTAILFAGVRRLEHDKTHLDLQQRANIQFAAISEGLDNAIEALQTVNRLFATMELVSREQFHAFTQPLLERYPYIQAFSFHRIVSAAGRPGYEAGMRKRYPDFAVTELADGKPVPAKIRDRHSIVDYIEPMKGNEAAFGLDLMPNLYKTKALQRANSTGLASSTDLFQLPQGADAKTGFVVVMPVYQYGASLDDAVSRRHAVIGSTTAVFRVNDLIHKILKSGGFLDAAGTGFSVYAGETPDERDLMFRHGSAPALNEIASVWPEWLFWDHTISVSRTFEMAGKPRLMVVSANHAPFTVDNSDAFLVLMAGTMLSLLAAAYMQTLVSRSQRIQRLVDARTAELTEANARLNEDIETRKRYEAELAFQASHDSLTGLANPGLLRNRVSQAIAYADRYGHSAWLLFVDIDRFKFVNDILSHKAGDMVLKSVSERLLSTVRESDTVARIGGEEFVLVLSERMDESLVENALQRIMDAVAQPIVVEGHEFSLSCSVGIAVYPGDGADPESLIKNAGIAMYRAKEMGQHHFQFYSPAMNQRATERVRIAADLRHGLEHGEFVLHYQPQVDLRTGRIDGMEALIRWRHPELGMVAPSRFIGLAEEMGLIVPLGAWVLRTACRQNKAWQDAGLEPVCVAVNLSARQFYQQDLAAAITAVLQESGLAPHYLEIELTESLVMTDVEQAVDILRSLKKIGVHVSIDDFGTGYSSLSYLKRFPIDVLKIDQSFVRDVTTDPDDAMIANSIISLAHSLRLEVIAEGVETEAQLAYLRRHGCDRMQGFYFSRPVPAEEFEQILRQRKCLLAPDAGTARRQTLLIVDDEPDILATLQRLLRRENYLVLTAQTPAAGFELLALHEVQVILCDQRMPEMNGVEFLTKAKDMYPDTIRIMLSGYAELKSVIEAINRGATYRFFTKPWDDDALRGHIREAFDQYWLRHAAAHPGSDRNAAAAEYG